LLCRAADDNVEIGGRPFTGTLEGGEPMPTRRALLLTAAAAAAVRPAAAPSAQPEAAPTVLRVERQTLEVNGRSATVLAIRQPDGTAGIVANKGGRFRVRVENRLGEPSLIHWHGLAPPWKQDGVPGVSGPPIAAGAAADYDFPLAYGGTFWMHSHQGLQEQLLLDAPLIIRDARDRPGRQEIVVTLNDFSFTPPEEIFANLKKRGGMPGKSKMAGMAGMASMAAGAGPDLNDVAYDAFLANDRTLGDPEIVRVEPGAEVLLRVINAAAMSNFHFDLGRLKGRLIAVDGTRIAPVAGRRFPIAIAQRLDLVLPIPRATAAYPILATVEGASGRTGLVIAAGKAAIARIGETAPTPAPPLSMALERRLRALEPLPPKKPDRVHNIALTGDMAKYVWSIDGTVWSPAVPPLPIAKGERVALVITNKTQMPHPMHLHGHRFQVVEIDGLGFSGAVRDTVRVPAGGRVTVVFDADNPGWWAFHCHMLYHMEAGMFATFRYV
jgi:FtsP/CotA-like multicopper oxidase with cupredoxin domain